MKVYYKLFSIIIGLFIISNLSAQLPDGSIAEDWTLTDINGNVHSLYADYLDQGKSVIIDFSATWCGPCWNYHNTHIEKDLYNDFGPNATGEIMVFQIEADFSTNTNCLYGSAGCNNSTQGNWVSGTPYPIIDLQPADSYVKTDYQISYYPTLYAVCPDRKVYEVGQASYNTWKSWLLESCPLDASSTTTGVDCYEEMDGTIDLTTYEGYGNLSFNWSNGDNSEDINNLFPGIYTCTISDQHNRSIETGDIMVSGPLSPPQINVLELNDISCFGEGDGFISLSGGGGTPGYTFEWSNGASGPIQTGLAAGTYMVTIFDNNNCTEEIPLTILEPTELTASVSGTNENCGGSDGSIVVTASGGNGNNYYDIGIIANYTGVFNALPAGDYTIVVTDENGCFVQLSQTLINNLPPVAEAGTSQDIDCVNTIVTLDGSGSETGPDIVYLWSTSDGNILDGITSLNPEVDEAGTYQIQVFNTNTGCVSTDQVVVASTIDLPVADAGTESTIDCSITEVQLDGTASDSGPNIVYSWSTVDGNIIEGEDTAEPIVNASGTYLLLVTNEANGCSATDEVIVTQNGNVPVADAGVGGTINCNVQSVLLDGSSSDSGPNISYEWMTDDGNILEGQSTNQLLVDTSGTYILIVTDGSNGCTNSSSAEVLTDMASPQINITQDIITCNTVSATVCADSPGNVNYLWSDGSTSACIEVSISGPVTVNVTGENGCSSELETTIEENIELPSIDVGEDFSVDCTFENIELAASGDTGEGFTLNWSTDDGNIAEGEETDSPLVDSPGTYILEVVNNATGCITEESITISQFINTPISSFTENINGAQIIFTDNSAGEPDSWFWSFGDGNSSADQNPEHIYTESGMYEVCLTISNECGEDISCQNIQVSVTGALNFSAIIDHLTCFEEHNGSITVSVFGGQPGYTIVWTGPNGFSSSEFTITDLAAGEYNMEVSDDSGTILTESFIIEEPNAIIYSTQITQHVSCQGEADGIIDGSASGGLEPLSYAWSNGEETPSIQDLAAGVYTCTITDANGCTEEFTYEIVEPEALTLQNNDIIDATNGESNGSIDITISGGTEPYEYSWSSGETTEDVDGMAEGSYTCEVTDANGCIINLGPFEIMNSTGLSEIEGLTALKYFPNPASEQLFVELNFDRISDFKISLINKLGQRLSEETCHASTYKAEIQLDQLSEGIYFLLITKADQSIMEKIIVQR